MKTKKRKSARKLMMKNNNYSGDLVFSPEPSYDKDRLISKSAQREEIDLNESEQNDQLKKCVDRLDEWYKYFNEHIQRARNYLTFLYVDQWETQVRKDREWYGKPTLSLNKHTAIINGILGEFRENTPALSVRALDDSIPQDQIEWRTDHIRQIYYQSNAQIHFQTALKNALETGWGGLRICIDYENENTFDQCIKIKPIEDYQTGFWDPAAQEANKSDGDYCGYYEVVAKEDFKRLYPDVNPSQSMGNNYYFRWNVRDVVLVANMYYKEYDKKIIVKLSDGREMDKSEAKEEIKKTQIEIERMEQLGPEIGLESTSMMMKPLEIVQEREVLDYKICFIRFTDNAVLEHSEWPGKTLPIVYVEGNSTVIDGERIPISYIQDSIDVQRVINYMYSELAYSVLMSRREQFMGTKDNTRGYEDIWRNPQQVQGILLANLDPQTQQLPQVIPAKVFDQSLMEAVTASDQQLAQVLGRYDENRGNQSNAQSGIAIENRQRAGNNPVNMYIDNVTRGIEQCGKIILELMPFVYNNHRKVAVRDIKNGLRNIELNKPTGNFKFDEDGNINEIIQNDVSHGTYDVEVRVDGSYDQQRLDALNTLINFAKIYPPFAPILPDLIAEVSGLENAQVLIERAKTILPPSIQAQEEGKPPPPPPPPDPKVLLAQKQLELQQAQLQFEQQKLQMEYQLQQQKIQQGYTEIKMDSDRNMLDAQVSRHKADVELQKAKIGLHQTIAKHEHTEEASYDRRE